MNMQGTPNISLVKDFFYFTKSKLVVFVLLTVVFLYISAQQDMVLGNFTYSGALVVIGVLYAFLSTAWFSFKSKRHFIIGLILLAVLVVGLWLSGNYSSQKRQQTNIECLKQTNSTSMNAEVMRCMTSKGYKFYR